MPGGGELEPRRARRRCRRRPAADSRIGWYWFQLAGVNVRHVPPASARFASPPLDLLRLTVTFAAGAFDSRTRATAWPVSGRRRVVFSRISRGASGGKIVARIDVALMPTSGSLIEQVAPRGEVGVGVVLVLDACPRRARRRACSGRPASCGSSPSPCSRCRAARRSPAPAACGTARSSGSPN